MNKPNSELKRLMAWASRAAPPRPEEAPFGFAGRVVAKWNPNRARSLWFELQHLAWPSAFASAGVILAGLVVLLAQTGVPEPAATLSSALPFLVNNLVP